MAIYTILNDYQDHVDERLKRGIPPKTLSLAQTESVIVALNTLLPADTKKYLDWMICHMSPGANETASIKASFLGRGGDIDAQQLTKENHSQVFRTVGVRIEVSGYSLCMGNQAQTKENAVVISIFTRNFSNRLRKNTKVFFS